MSNVELKLCPFCGEKATIIRLPTIYEEPRFFPSCGNCGAEMPRVYRTREEAIEAWNRRA